MPRKPRNSGRKGGRPVGLAGAWKPLAEAYGGTAKLAALCDVTRQTLERWARGAFQPGSIVRDHVTRLAKRKGLESPWTAREVAGAPEPRDD